MKPRALHTRLAAALLLLLVLVGAVNLYSTLVTTDLYVQEVIQGTNSDLALNIARMKSDQLLTADGRIPSDGIDQLFHWMMVVNPGPRFYLLALDGEIVAYDPSAGELGRNRVDVEPIRRFLEQLDGGDLASGRPAMTILGEDPHEPGSRRVFSAAPIPPDGRPVGYLYIVLSSQHVESVADRLRDSYILRLSTRNFLAYFGVVLLSGLMVFGFLTRPLRRLVSRMKEFLQSGDDGGRDADLEVGDEVRLLARTFDEMTQRIERQMSDIERMSGAHRELIANVSHDLRTPIASLQGYLETLVLKGAAVTDAEREEYLQISLRQSQRLGRLVEELFELTKLEAKEVKPCLERFRIAELVQDNVQRFQLQAASKGVRLAADFDPGLPPVFADIGLMERALENLIENALRFTPEGGSVTVELREELHRLAVRVVDTGCGIPAEDLPHIFDRHYRSRFNNAASTTGAGLGLAITRQIAELHGSELEVESNVGAGTVFSFSLTVAPRTHELTLADVARATASQRAAAL